MDLFQATEAAEWARKCYADELARAQQGRTHTVPRNVFPLESALTRLTRHQAFATTVVLVLITILVVAAA